MISSQWVYAALCVFVPVLWGLGVYAVSNRIERRVLRERPQTGPQGEEDGLPLDYHI